MIPTVLSNVGSIGFSEISCVVSEPFEFLKNALEGHLSTKMFNMEVCKQEPGLEKWAGDSLHSGHTETDKPSMPRELLSLKMCLSS